MRLIIFLTLFLTGCAGVGYGGKQGSPFVSLDPIKDGWGQIYIYRPYQKFWLLAYPNISVNGEIVGELRNGTYISIDVPPGEHDLEVIKNSYWAIQMFSKVSVQSGQRVFIRTGSRFGGVSADVLGTFGILHLSASATMQHLQEDFSTSEV